jgi:hypothetical protein
MAEDKDWKLPEATVVLKNGKSTVYPPGAQNAPKSATPTSEVAAKLDEKQDGAKK